MNDQPVTPRVLVVEDNEMNRDMLTRRLARNGFVTLVAEDGERGVELAGAELPDLILMDIQPARHQRAGSGGAYPRRPGHGAHSNHRAHRPGARRRPRKGPGGRVR